MQNKQNRYINTHRNKCILKNCALSWPLSEVKLWEFIYQINFLMCSGVYGCQLVESMRIVRCILGGYVLVTVDYQE
jgi:hypothetical protein